MGSSPLVPRGLQAACQITAGHTVASVLQSMGWPFHPGQRADALYSYPYGIAPGNVTGRLGAQPQPLRSLAPWAFPWESSPALR